MGSPGVSIVESKTRTWASYAHEDRHDQPVVRKIRLQRRLEGERVPVDTLHFHALMEANVGEADAGPLKEGLLVSSFSPEDRDHIGRTVESPATAERFAVVK